MLSSHPCCRGSQEDVKHLFTGLGSVFNCPVRAGAYVLCSLCSVRLAACTDLFSIKRSFRALLAVLCVPETLDSCFEEKSLEFGVRLLADTPLLPVPGSVPFLWCIYLRSLFVPVEAPLH